MRADVQEIFKMTPHDKQVMMFSATLSKEIRPVCKKFMQDVSLFKDLFITFKQAKIWYKAGFNRELNENVKTFLPFDIYGAF